MELWAKLAGAWTKLSKFLEDPIARSCVAEGVFTIILLLIVIALVLGWKPKLTTIRASLMGLLLLAINFGALFLMQERNLDLYFGTFWFLILPILFLISFASYGGTHGNISLIAFWMFGLLEFGVVLNNYVTMLSIAVIMTISFQLWRNPTEEGFIRTKLIHWGWAVGAFALLLIITALMVVFGWENALATRYLKENRWMLPVSAALFFLVKAVPEELIFRGIFQGALKDKIGFRSALISSASLYGIAALNNPAPWTFPNWHAAINAVLLGLVCGIVYEKTKSLAVSATVNASVSFMWFTLLAKGGF
ncbi:MAG: CPBP family intramembrane glutamic endopeptidase [Patescibacteria group bacterium]